MHYTIYSIHRLDTDDDYIGYTSNFPVRRNNHRFELNHGRHHNIPLQRDWTELGQTAFDFITVAELDCDKSEAKCREAEWIGKIGSYNQMIANLSGDGTTMNDHLRSNMADHMARRHREGDLTIKNGLKKAVAAAQITNGDRIARCWDDPKFRAQQTEKIKEMWCDPVFRSTMASAQAERWTKPEEHVRQHEALLKAWQSRNRKNGLPRGVTRCDSKSERYAASLWYDGKAHHIGVFDTIESASAAYKTARKKLGV